MYWKDMLNVQNVEKGFFSSSNPYGIPDLKPDEFPIKELIPYRVDKNRNGTAHFFLDDYRFERCWKNADSQLAVLKQYVEPLLFGVEKDSPEYMEAKRLLKFFDYFIGFGSDYVPMNSLLREFIGGGCFQV